MHRYRLSAAVLAALAALACAAPAAADVRQSAADALVLEWSARVSAPPSAAYEALGRIGEWWSGAHTYSGDAANLSLRAEAGACFCERWREGSVEHGRVVLALKDRMLRVDGALGPLQAKAVAGVLTFALKPDGPGTTLAITYRVNGAGASALDQDAASVDRVLAEQVARLARFVDTGKPLP